MVDHLDINIKQGIFVSKHFLINIITVDYLETSQVPKGRAKLFYLVFEN